MQETSPRTSVALPADDNSARARVLYNLGVSYKKGQGVPADMSKAAEVCVCVSACVLCLFLFPLLHGSAPSRGSMRADYIRNS